MKLHPILQRSLLACATGFLLLLAWQTLSGGFRQLSRSRTAGQRAETLVQIECGGLSLLVILTSFRWRRWAQAVRILWGASLATAAGLSALVWGPAMPPVAAFFVAIALLVVRVVTRILPAAER